MALVTVQRPSSSNTSPEVSLLLEQQYDEKDGTQDFCSSLAFQANLAVQRQRSFSESYFAVKGAALLLPHYDYIHRAIKSKQGDIQHHLQSMSNLLRPEDTLKMAVELETRNEGRQRYLLLITNSGQQNMEECCIVGLDFTNNAFTIGLVLPIFATTKIMLDGDGGFVLNVNDNSHIFKPVSVQAMWSALQSVHRACDLARMHNYFRGGASHAWTSHYESRVGSDRTALNEWYALDEITSTQRPVSPSKVGEMRTEREEMESMIRSKLKEIMMSVDLEEVTSKYLRCELEKVVGCGEGGLTEYKGYIDEEMITVLGQMDSATEILNYLYLGSEWNASNYDELKDNNISHILNVTKEIDNFFIGLGFEYKNIRVYDEEETELLHYFTETNDFINEAREKGAKVLVHCKMGVSRSATAVIAYVMKTTGLSLKDTLRFVKNKRSCVRPNPSFMRQLEEYQGILDASKQRHNSIFRSKSEMDLSLTPSEAKRKRSESTNQESSLGSLTVQSTDDLALTRPKSWSPNESMTSYLEDQLSKEFLNSQSNNNEWGPRTLMVQRRVSGLRDTADPGESTESMFGNNDGDGWIGEQPFVAGGTTTVDSDVCFKVGSPPTPTFVIMGVTETESSTDGAGGGEATTSEHPGEMQRVASVRNIVQEFETQFCHEEEPLLRDAAAVPSHGRVPKRFLTFSSSPPGGTDIDASRDAGAGRAVTPGVVGEVTATSGVVGEVTATSGVVGEVGVTPGVTAGVGTTPGVTAGVGTTPGVTAGDGTTPGVTAGVGTTPGVTSGVGTTPGVASGVGTTPGVTAGVGTTPGVTAGVGTTPGVTAGVGTTPGVTAGVGTTPEVTAGVGTTPGATEGVGTTPEVTAGVGTTPGVTAGVGTTPGVTAGVGTTPGVTAGVGTTPGITAGVGTTPEVTAGVGTTPGVTAGVGTTPVVTAGVGTTPEVTSGVGTTPGVTAGVGTTPGVTAGVGTTPGVTSGVGTTPWVTAGVGTTPGVVGGVHLTADCDRVTVDCERDLDSHASRVRYVAAGDDDDDGADPGVATPDVTRECSNHARRGNAKSVVMMFAASVQSSPPDPGDLADSGPPFSKLARARPPSLTLPNPAAPEEKGAAATQAPSTLSPPSPGATVAGVDAPVSPGRAPPSPRWSPGTVKKQTVNYERLTQQQDTRVRGLDAQVALLQRANSLGDDACQGRVIAAMEADVATRPVKRSRSLRMDTQGGAPPSSRATFTPVDEKQKGMEGAGNSVACVAPSRNGDVEAPPTSGRVRQQMLDLERLATDSRADAKQCSTVPTSSAAKTLSHDNNAEPNSVRAHLAPSLTESIEARLYDLSEMPRSDSETLLAPDVIYENKMADDATTVAPPCGESSGEARELPAPPAIVTGSMQKHYVPVGIGTVRQQKEVLENLSKEQADSGSRMDKVTLSLIREIGRSLERAGPASPVHEEACCGMGNVRKITRQIEMSQQVGNQNQKIDPPPDGASVPGSTVKRSGSPPDGSTLPGSNPKRSSAPPGGSTVSGSNSGVPADGNTILGSNYKRSSAPPGGSTLSGSDPKHSSMPADGSTVPSLIPKRSSAPAGGASVPVSNQKQCSAPAGGSTASGANVKRNGAPPNEAADAVSSRVATATASTLSSKNPTQSSATTDAPHRDESKGGTVVEAAAAAAEATSAAKQPHPGGATAATTAGAPGKSKAAVKCIKQAIGRSRSVCSAAVTAGATLLGPSAASAGAALLAGGGETRAGRANTHKYRKTYPFDAKCRTDSVAQRCAIFDSTPAPSRRSIGGGEKPRVSAESKFNALFAREEDPVLEIRRTHPQGRTHPLTRLSRQRFYNTM